MATHLSACISSASTGLISVKFYSVDFLENPDLVKIDPEIRQFTESPEVFHGVDTDIMQRNDKQNTLLNFHRKAVHTYYTNL
jgi:molecular chaperone DnaK (HSP70)